MNFFKYLRVRIFYFLLRPISIHFRKSRMRRFVKIIKPFEGLKVLDLGGQPDIWNFVETPLNITCLNLPGIAMVDCETHHKIKYVEGDACDMTYFRPGDFDLVFSNSVIEHVGSIKKQLQFANEVIRISSTYWIQTPCKAFPIEPHCGMPFWWYYPGWLKNYFLSGWSKKLPTWTEMVRNTRVVNKEDLCWLFPNSRIYVERLYFLPKSLVAYSIEKYREKHKGRTLISV